MIAQLDVISLGSDPKTWTVLIGATLLTMIVGRFIQAFRAGAGIKEAALSVWLGTNGPGQAQAIADKKNTTIQ